MFTPTIREGRAGGTLVQRRTCRDVLTRMQRRSRSCRERRFLPGAGAELESPENLLGAGAGAVYHNEPRGSFGRRGSAVSQLTT